GTCAGSSSSKIARKSRPISPGAECYIGLRGGMPMRVLVFLLAAASLDLAAGGSNYNVTPGTLPVIQGQVREWDVPTPKFARDPAPAPDGSMYITVMHGDKIAHFDPKTQRFREWDLPAGAHPHGLVVDRQGIVFYTGNGNGTIGRLDPATGK